MASFPISILFFDQFMTNLERDFDQAWQDAAVTEMAAPHTLR